MQPRYDILTATGKQFDFDACEPFVIGDIVHSLSHICRFNGHVRRFYSVAQHSVLVSYVVPPEFALAALMHDAAEAYLGDVSRPLKRRLPDYQAIEQQLEARLFAHFGLPAELAPEVKHADLVLLATEKRDLMPRTDEEFFDTRGVQPLPVPIEPVTSDKARAMFWRRWDELQRAHAGAAA